MSIQVNEFRHIPGENDTEYIKLLKESLERQKQITSKAIAKIKELSGSSESPNGWIPCSERLVNKTVLCCDKRGEMIIGYVFKDKTSDTGFSAENDTEYMYNCVAWQTLPEPWKGEE